MGVCGFANAQGGTICIGIDDAGNVIGVKNIKKLMEDALIDQSKVPKGQNEPLGEPKENLLIDKIILLLRDNPKATYDDLVTELSVSRSTIKRAMGNLVANGRIARVGGKRYGHWKIND